MWTYIHTCLCVYAFIYKHIYIYTYLRVLVLLSCRIASTDFLDSLLPLVPIIHRFRQVLQTTSCVRTELL